LKNDPMKSYEPIWWIYGIYGLSFGSHMGMGQTYYYHIRGNNHPLTSHSRVPKVPEFWLIAIW
jgi:hypothetical protein